METRFPKVNALGSRPEYTESAQGGVNRDGKAGERIATSIVAEGRYGGSRERGTEAGGRKKSGRFSSGRTRGR